MTNFSNGHGREGLRAHFRALRDDSGCPAEQRVDQPFEHRGSLMKSIPRLAQFDGLTRAKRGVAPKVIRCHLRHDATIVDRADLACSELHNCRLSTRLTGLARSGKRLDSSTAKSMGEEF